MSESPLETQLRKAGPYSTGTGIQRIVMRRDGAGPMGWYDVIYLYDYSGVEVGAMPAHTVDFWIKE